MNAEPLPPNVLPPRDILPAETSRALVIAALSALAGMAILSAILAYLLFRDLGTTKDVDRLGPFSDPIILNRVPGVNGPAARQGDVITYRGERCAVQTTVVELTIFYRVEGQGQATVPGEALKTDLLQGCFSPSQQLTMPNGVTPGTGWQLNGIVRDQHSGEVRYWTSEKFTVIQ